MRQHPPPENLPGIREYNTYVPKATIEADVDAAGLAVLPIDRFDEALQTVARSITQVRVHERLLQLAGVRLDRAGATLLFKLSASGESLRVTDLAEMLGVDTPTVTRKVQQLERDGMVVRQSDPDDRRASRIGLPRPVAGPSNGCGGPAELGSTGSWKVGTTTTWPPWPTCSVVSPRTSIETWTKPVTELATRPSRRRGRRRRAPPDPGDPWRPHDGDGPGRP